MSRHPTWEYGPELYAMQGLPPGTYVKNRTHLEQSDK